MSSIPAISLVMKVYNGEAYIKEAIDSILAQTFSDFELLIIDDGSTDASADIVLSYSDPRIKFLQNETNLGLCETQNKVIAAAAGKYIAVMDCDDVSYPTRFEKQAAFLDAHPDIMLCGTARSNLENGIETPFGALFPLTLETLRLSLLFGNFYFTHSSIMFRAKEYRENGFSYELALCEDYDIISRIAMRFPVALLNERLIAYRILPHSMSHTRMADVRKYTADIQCRMLDALPLNKKNKTVLSDYFKMGVSVTPLSAFYAALTEAAEYFGADISQGGNAAPLAEELSRQFLANKHAYAMDDWREVRQSPFPQLARLNTDFGRKLFFACLLHYKRR